MTEYSKHYLNLRYRKQYHSVYRNTLARDTRMLKRMTIAVVCVQVGKKISFHLYISCKKTTPSKYEHAL